MAEDKKTNKDIVKKMNDETKVVCKFMGKDAKGRKECTKILTNCYQGTCKDELIKEKMSSIESYLIYIVGMKVDAQKTNILLSNDFTKKIEEWKSILTNRGIQINKIEKLNNNQNYLLNRKEEISQWFQSHTIEDNFVILDDDTSLNELPNFIKSHLVLTKSMIGLNESHLLLIREILKNKQMDYEK